MKFSKPDIESKEDLPVRLVLCLDGTGDTAEGSFSAVGGESWNLTRSYWFVREITFSVGATVGTKDSIKSIFDMTKAGTVADSTGKKVFQVGCAHSLSRQRINIANTPNHASLCNTLRVSGRWVWLRMQVCSQGQGRCLMELQGTVFHAYSQ